MVGAKEDENKDAAMTDKSDDSVSCSATDR